jgi:hypothetical protein
MQERSTWTEGKTWLYRGYQVTHARDGKSLEVRKGSGPPIKSLAKPVTYKDVTDYIDRLHPSAP